ncbi:MAG: hypothetical protein HY833_00730 [Candidatus Aenigmarchaeota archaeon]|nr:hypothetical protein [Candidatus Aenigmarchaeota archaeon]
MGYSKVGRYGAENHIVRDDARASRFEVVPVESRSLSEIYNSDRVESPDRGMNYIKEIVDLQGRIQSLLKNEIYTQSELARDLGCSKKNAFMVGAALDYMLRKYTIGIVGSKPGPEKNMVEPVYSTYFKC